jgi:1-phosphatidylinositol-4-phosphate 5-kinase
MKHEGIGGMVRFVIMNNWFNTGLSLDEKYDLKGSTVGRTIGVPEDVRKAGSILKDLDIKRKVWYPEELRGKFLEQLKIDAAVRRLSFQS